ncbi:uncharacterized protein TEOVI_000043400 [Trypanosoma equiperdum]|uniref:Uncharacterized protein n=2 Tax=Trypanozoon TaxID=39700 RepID=Q57Y87_TRYB2|nr:hypothetical protein, conserved [Trypanosoma brucei brucei TREU927]AAX69398.1 hypothetical protein, conserved [Trypanosoma brucei]AAZ12341.1 hypothetical protein, conserved [Trypanosoma brucei brucei TREU927]SCU67435.1 hypothetical protein, conserved [Trypanosoma equiperdum]
MFRKRYRPLDPAEERSVGVEQALHVGFLRDEQSYCFRWPDAPLTAMLRRSDDSLVLGMQSGSGSGTQNAVVLPPVPRLSAVLAEHDKAELFSSLSTNNTAISFSADSSSASGIVLNRGKRQFSAPASTCVDDSVFSFSSFQMKELESSGALKAFYEAHAFSTVSATGDGCDKVLKVLARRRMEEEIVRLEWRAYYETEKVSPAIQRILLLTVAVPFLDNFESSVLASTEGEAKWQRIIYELWVKWRIGSVKAGEVATASDGTPWGAPLLPGSFVSSLSREYFTTVGPDRSGALRGVRANDAKGADGEGCQVLSSAAVGRRGAYGYLRWRIDLYEPRLRAVPKEGDDEYGLSSSTKLVGAAEVNNIVEEKVPSVLCDVRLGGRVDPLDALALTDIRSDVGTWRQWLAHV